MDDLPFDLLDRIFKFACTDDGRTGCTLSAVSHHIRDVSAPMRYHSIALQGARQIRTFIQLLIDPIPKPTETKPKTKTQSWMGKIKRTKPKPLSRTTLPSPIFHVRYLFLADMVEWGLGPVAMDWIVETPAEKKIRLKALGRKPELHDFHGERWRPTFETAETLAWSTVADLLTRLAPTLEHLCNYQWIPGSVLFAIHFPVLVEVTCFLMNDGHDATVNTSAVDLSVKMPALERLHYVNKIHGRSSRWLSAKTLPASLSLVRFSYIQVPRYLVFFLAGGENSPWAGQNKLQIIVSRSVESYIDYDVDLVRACWVPLSEWYDERPALYAIIPKVHMIEEPESYDKQRLYQEWLSRVQGQEGIWNDKGIPLSLMIEGG